MTQIALELGEIPFRKSDNILVHHPRGASAVARYVMFGHADIVPKGEAGVGNNFKV